MRAAMRLASVIATTLAAIALTSPGAARAADASVAVAANFTDAANDLARAFNEDTGHSVRISTGSTGKLYAQIRHGAPFDVFLAADGKRPGLLVEEGLARADSRFTYAVGRLALWSPDGDLISGDGPTILREGKFRHLAIASPKLAPYGAAAKQTLEALGLWDELSPRLVQGENIGQTFQFVATGNAELGFVALSQVMSPHLADKGSRWEVPGDLYDPVRQDAVLLKHGGDNDAARAFLAFLRGDKARALITSYGYGIED